MSCKSLANLCRSLIGHLMRTREKLMLNVLIAGWDESNDKPVLFWLDEIGSIQEVPFACHGNDFSFVLSLLDQSNRQKKLTTLDFDDGIIVARSCWDAIRKRTTGNMKNCKMWAVVKDGWVNLGVI